MLMITFELSAMTYASAEDCPNYNFSEIFVDEYTGSTWAGIGQKRTITWSASADLIEDEYLSRAFIPAELDWLMTAVASWDSSLESIDFLFTQSQTADLVIGYVPLVSRPTAAGKWNAWTKEKVRYRGIIKLNSNINFLNTKEGFIHMIQHELGNILGLGDIVPNLKFDSVMEDPMQPPFGPVSLSDFDVGLVRQLYGESTCPSSWKMSSQQEVEVKTKPSKKSLDATCTKGKVTKKVSGTSLKCPKGYKKKLKFTS